MIRTAQRTFHTPALFMRNAGRPGELDRLCRDLDRQIDEAAGRLEEIGQIRSRHPRCRALGLLVEDNARAYTGLRERSNRLAGLVAHDEPDMETVRERMATVRWLGITADAAVKLMKVYEDQLPFEEAVMATRHAQELLDEHLQLCTSLAASSDPEKRDRAALAIAIVPAEHRGPFMALAPAGSAMRFQVDAWLERHGGRTLTLPQLLLIRHLAHAHSGAFPAISGLEILGGMNERVARSLGAIYPDLVCAREASVGAMHALPGLRLTREGASFCKGMGTRHNPVLKRRLQPYHALSFRYSISATLHAIHSYVGSQGHHQPGDALLRFHCGGLAGGPIRAVRCDIFNIEGKDAQGEVLLVGPQTFRVIPGRVETCRDREGGSTEVQHFDLHRMSDAPPNEDDIE